MQCKGNGFVRFRVPSFQVYEGQHVKRSERGRRFACSRTKNRPVGLDRKEGDRREVESSK